MSSHDGKSERLHAVAESVNTFGAKLLVEYRKEQNPNSNIVFSPLNLATTFHLLYEGAGGTTKTEIDNLLNFSNPDVESSLTGKSQDLAMRGAARMAYRLYIGNSVQLLEDYIARVGSNQVLSVDFGHNSEPVRNEINGWVNQETHGLIPTLVSEGHITSTTIMALVNALYFKGKWRHPFHPMETRAGVFHGVNGDQNISYMTLGRKRLHYKEVQELDGVMFELPYEEKDFGLYVFLPKEVDGWKQAEQAYPEYAGKIFSSGFTSMHVKDLKLPKWEMNSTFEGLENGLKSLGMKELFTRHANLSAMTNNSPLSVSTVIHKAKIIVNEEVASANGARNLMFWSRALKQLLLLYIVISVRLFLLFA